MVSFRSLALLFYPHPVRFVLRQPYILFIFCTCWLWLAENIVHTLKDAHTHTRASDLKDRVESRYAVDFVVARHFPPLVHRGSPVPGCFAPNTCQHFLFSASLLLKVSHLKRRQVGSSFHMGPRLLEQDTLHFYFYFILFICRVGVCDGVRLRERTVGWTLEAAQWSCLPSSVYYSSATTEQRFLSHQKENCVSQTLNQ